MPAVAGQVFVRDDGDGAVVEAQAKLYWLTTVTCMCMMQWLYLYIFNAVRRLPMHMTAHRDSHVQALMTLIRYIVSNENRGLVLAPKEMWGPEYKFKVHG